MARTGTVGAADEVAPDLITGTLEGLIPMNTLKWHAWKGLLILATLASSGLVLEAGKRWT